ncbi:DUF1573 domain-containing protein [Hathewaya massiliensis]|uniref:DUF1573 domain-containing protein n=1 Tax=Hathewaya massiliensis TaxID=1964382 RepID=UPI00115B2E73|nr:DUF1573 domain-containing protein [Hathewaya massiliensis]
MKDILFDQFQNSVEECLIRHKSVLDILTKLQESEARVNRAVCKSVTNCGCIEINAKKQINLPKGEDLTLESLNNMLNSHLQGKICDDCRDIVENELGNHMFYLTALCNILNINLYDVLIKESNKIVTLGEYTLR